MLYPRSGVRYAGRAPMTTTRTLPDGAVGIGFRVEIAADLVRDPGCADFVEVVAEACFASPAARREAVALARVWPVVPHGVKLSLGSAEGVDVERARKLGDLARDLGAPVITEHVAFVRGGGREIGHLTQIPFTREALRVVTRNVARARRHFPDVPLLLENAAWTFRWPDDEIREGTFYTEIAERTGCDLLLDLGNLHANAVNAGVDPVAALESYPLERVAMIHIAGGVTEDGFYFDTHAAAVPEVVFDLLARATARTGAVPVVLERDAAFPPFAELAAEVARARTIVKGKGAPRAPSRSGASESAVDAEGEETRAMAAAQAAVAAMLTASAEPAPEEARPFGERAIRRSRAILRHKRVDDALPLLTHLLAHREVVRPIAEACLAETPRARLFAGVADAMRIAQAAEGEEALAPHARLDLLLLRARFTGPDATGEVRPRSAPFVGRADLGQGRVMWAVKGMGAGANVRLVDRRG